MGTGALAATAARPHSARLPLLAGANLLAAIGGGRLLGAASTLGGAEASASMPLLALLLGNAISLGLLVLTRRFAGGKMLALFSVAAVLASAGLLLSVYASGAGGVSALFFLLLVSRYGLWAAARSLRSDFAATRSRSGLALAEAAYFAGFIVGLLIDTGSALVALLLDALLLVVVAVADIFHWQHGPSRRAEAEAPIALPALFWRLTAAFVAASLACQVVVFYYAAAFSASSELVVAVFYAGIAVAALFCTHAKPALLWDGAAKVALHTYAVLRLPLNLLALGAGLLTALGLLWLPAASGLAAIGVGAALFEVLVLALVGHIRRQGRRNVALAYGLTAASAALGLFLLTVSGVTMPILLLFTAAGFLLAAACYRAGR